MLNIDKKLLKLESENKIIRIGIVGVGQMGRGLVNQMTIIKGMRVSIVCSRNVENAVNAILKASIKKEDILIANTLQQANEGIEKGKYVVTPYAEIVTKANLIDCVIDATGVPEVGAFVAYESIINGKHVVMLNLETDVVIGPYLNNLAKQNNVIYTGSAGDEPGSVMELYSFANAIGFDVRVIGKGKNNKMVRECTPQTVLDEALNRKMNPKMLCAFKDGTKTMVEMAAMSNATGFIVDVDGGHGVKANVNELSDVFKLKKDGGILSNHKVVEYVDGIAPGVFVVVYSDNDEYVFHMDYLKMGKGPLWTLYRPYHLCNLETPITVAKIMLENEATIQPTYGLVSEVVAVAKKDLNLNDKLDGIGGFMTYGSVTTYKNATINNYVPLGLINENSRVIKPIKKGQTLTWDNIEVDTTTLIYKLRTCI